MAPPDDEIPDLFPDDLARARRGSVSREEATRKAAGRPSAPPPVGQSRAVSGSAAAPRALPPQATPRVATALPGSPRVGSDSEPRPSRPIPGRESGLELEAIEETLPQETKATLIAGSVDELEFDPTSVPPPPLKGPPQALRFPSEEGPRDALDVAPAPKSRAPRSSRPPSSRPPRVDASASSAVSVPSLDIPSPQPVRAPASIAQTPSPRPAPSRQSERAPSPAAGGAAPNVDLAAFPGLGNEVDLGEGLDELDFGGAAAAQLNVGLPAREPDDDIPWPTCRTPEGAELALDHTEAERLSGFGRAPDGIFQTPLYALRVFRALDNLKKTVADAERRLLEVEDRRDEKLAVLAEENRSKLQRKDRFSSLYAQVERREKDIALKKTQLEMADVEGAQALRDVQAQIDTKSAERIDKERTRDERRVVLEEAERQVKRFLAADQRVQIEWRNIEARAAKAPGSDMPDELDARLDELEEQRARIKKDLSAATEQYKAFKKAFHVSEDDLRVASAEVRRAEAQKEGLLIAYEGEIADRSRALDGALFERQTELAGVARAILDLRGEVPVSGTVRTQLLGADREVMEAARRLETTRLALRSVDSNAYTTGRAIWIGVIVLAVALLLLLAL